MGVWYATREDVMAALDAAESVRSIAQIDRLLERASRSVELRCHRRFYPQRDTRYVAWPDDQLGTAHCVYLDGAHELISLTSLTSGGTTISTGDVHLEPHAAGPPYTRLELDQASGVSFAVHGSAQRSLAITGVFGACADYDLAVNTADAVNSTSSTITIRTGQPVGVGALLRIDAELVQVIGKLLVDSTVTTSSAVDSSPGTVLIPVASGDEAQFPLGEAITLAAERMLVTDRYAGRLVVERQWSGSLLAAHASGSAIRVPRQLVVRRGQLGTIAASHSSGAQVDLFTPPPLVRDLTIAEALVGLSRELSGYARTVGSGEAVRNASSGDIADLRKECYGAHGRKARVGVV